MELLDDVLICCRMCNEIIWIRKEDIDFETYDYDHGDNAMGTEVEYTYKEVLECPKCGNSISVGIYGSEYPIGAFNFEDSHIDGGYFHTEPHMIVIYDQVDFCTDIPNSKLERIDRLIVDIAENYDRIYDISSREFEEIVECLLQDKGFETRLTPKTRDGCVDIIAIKYEIGKPVCFYVECKRVGRKKSIGINIVRSLFGVQMADRINKSLLVTTGRITHDARRFVDGQKMMMSVIDTDEIHKLIRQSALKRGII